MIFVVAFLGLRIGSFLASSLIGEIECVHGAREGPEISTGVDCAVVVREGPGMSDIGVGAAGADCLLLLSCVISSAFRLRLSSNQNFSIFFLFRLYSPTVLHATKLIRRNLGSVFSTRFVFCVFSVVLAVSFDIDISLFFITVFFLL